MARIRILHVAPVRRSYSRGHGFIECHSSIHAECCYATGVDGAPSPDSHLHFLFLFLVQQPAERIEAGPTGKNTWDRESYIRLGITALVLCLAVVGALVLMQAHFRAVLLWFEEVSLFTNVRASRLSWRPRPVRPGGAAMAYMAYTLLRVSGCTWCEASGVGVGWWSAWSSVCCLATLLTHFPCLRCH